MSTAGAAARERVVALVGNPNTGKSTIFSGLTGVAAHIANFPGVTVDAKIGRMRIDGLPWVFLDLPGIYSLEPRSPDERIAVEALHHGARGIPTPDLLVAVVDASNLERNLFLLAQLRELRRPLVVALTMLDVARSRGLTIDVDRLRERLGVPVVLVEGRRAGDLEPLKREIARIEELADRRAPAPSDAPPATNGAPPAPTGASEVVARYQWVDTVVEGTVQKPVPPRVTFGDRLDRVLTHRFWGVVFLVGILLVVFNAVFTWAQVPMEWIDLGVGWISARLAERLPEGPLASLLVDGVVGGIGAVIIFLPQIAILFLFLGILEECGYLARAAHLLDRLMVGLGLSGKSFLPLLSSFACAVPGIMATRVIEDRRDRFTTILVAPFMSCSARLPVYTLVIAGFVPNHRYLGGSVGLQGITLLSFYALGIVVAAAVAWGMRRFWFRSEPAPLILELPAYRLPNLRLIVRRVLERVGDFVGQAGTLILAISIVMWAGLYYPRLSTSEQARFDAQRAQLETVRSDAPPARRAQLDDQLRQLDIHAQSTQRRQSLLGRAGHFVEPAVRPLGWDWRIATAALASFPAREVVVAALGVLFEVDAEDAEGERLTSALRNATWDGTDRLLFTVPTALSLAVFFALCAQCVSTLAVMRRETQSWAWPLVSFTGMTALAYVAALVTYQVGTRLAGA